MHSTEHTRMSWAPGHAHYVPAPRHREPGRKEQLFSGVLRKLSITLCKTSARLEQGVSGFLWGPAGCASGMARDAPPLRSVIGISALP
jgi:hypothetical protein